MDSSAARFGIPSIRDRVHSLTFGAAPFFLRTIIKLLRPSSKASREDPDRERHRKRDGAWPMPVVMRKSSIAGLAPQGMGFTDSRWGPYWGTLNSTRPFVALSGSARQISATAVRAQRKSIMARPAEGEILASSRRGAHLPHHQGAATLSAFRQALTERAEGRPALQQD